MELSSSAVAKSGGISADTDVHVARDDQAKINRFARLNAKLTDLQDEVKEKQGLVQNMEDASDELMMLDDDVVPFLVADAFFHVSLDDATSQLEAAKSDLVDGVAEMNARCSQYKEEMALLKRDLYAKFGDNINLEADEEE